MPFPSDSVAVIQQAVKAKKYRIGWHAVHAVQHMFEEGFDTSQLLEALSGKLTVLEEYEDDNRVLVLGEFRISEHTTCPLHAVCDFATAGSVDVVTAYIPSPPQWDNPRQRGFRK